MVYAVAFICAFVGWRQIVWTPLLKRYLCWAGLLSAWVLLSSIGAWDSFAFSFHYSRLFALIFAFIVPGIASLARDSRYRKALIGGLAATVLVLALVATSRLIEGRSVFDVPGNGTTLFGTGRNAINALALATIPFLLSKSVPRVLTWLRWPLLALSGVLVVSSGGRSGLLGLILAGLLFVLVQKRIAQRFKVLYAILAVATLAFVGIQAVGGQAASSSQRLVLLVRGERTTDEESRALLLKKAWHVAMEHPLLGVGYARFRSVDSPVVDEQAKSSYIRREATFGDAHDAYGQLMAEGGFPALFLFIGLMAAVLRGGFALRRFRDMRLAVIAVTGVVFQLLFMDLEVVGVLFVPMALLLGWAMELDIDDATVSARSELTARTSSSV